MKTTAGYWPRAAKRVIMEFKVILKEPERRQHNPITEGVIWKQILFFFFPLLLSAFFQQLYNTVDAIIVGQAAGKEALAAVGGSAGSVLGIFITFFIGFSGGAAVLTSQYYGAENNRALVEALRVSLLAAGGLGLSGALLCFLFALPALNGMNTPPDVMGAALCYLRVAAPGLAGCALYNMGASALRAVGDAVKPLVVLIAGCITNIGLDLFFVAVLKKGAFGAALATVLCQFLSAFLVLSFLRGKEREILEKSGRRDTAGEKDREAEGKQGRNAAGERDRLEERRSVFRRIMKLGLPLGLSEVMYTFANLILMAAINTFGTDTAAAYAAYGKIDAIFWMVVASFGIAITTFVGQNIGAGRWDRVMQSIRDCAVMMFLVLGAIILVLFFKARPLQELFVRDPEVVAIGVDMMRFLLPFYLLYIPIEILHGALRGMGDSIIPAVITFFGICLLRSAWGFSAMFLRHTVYMVLLAFPVTWIVGTILFAAYFTWYVRRRAR